MYFKQKQMRTFLSQNVFVEIHFDTKYVLIFNYPHPTIPFLKRIPSSSCENSSQMCLYIRILHPTSEKLSVDMYNVNVVRK